MSSLAEALGNCQSYLPETFRLQNERLFHPEHLAKLASRLTQFHQEGVPEHYPPPTMDVECTPPMSEIYEPFVEVMDNPSDSEALADALVNAGIEKILILLGQRHTPASLTDSRAIPRPSEFLLNSANEIFTGELSVGARALTKHLQRTTLEFWGQLSGNDQEKNRIAQEMIQGILSEATWWNVFFHYKHEVVFEARISQGYGARWGSDGEVFIGFLEPFTPGFPLQRE